MKKELNNVDIIKKSIISLRNSTRLSKLPDNEKEGLTALINKIDIYYDKKLNIIMNKDNDISSINHQIWDLKSFITDIIVEINNVLTGESDIYYFVNVINKRLNDREMDKVVKSKRK